MSGPLPSEHTEAETLEIAHVLFMDVVGYSRLPMDKQAAEIRRLIEILRGSHAFQNAETNDRLLRLPTGDGFALVFFGSPEEPVRCALEVSRALRADPDIHLRMGVHTGPIYRVPDINANRNVAGGGINVAQRVMDCGDQGHILVSNAVAEILVQLSAWEGNLHDLGQTEVKHGFRLHLYNLYTEDAGNPALPAKLRDGIVTAQTKRRRAVAPRWLGLAALLIVAVLVGVFVAGRIPGETSLPRFRRLTFWEGTVWSARFGSQGRTVVYSAAWNGNPVELFSTSPDGPESRSLGFAASDILALSPSSEMAFLLKGGSNLDWGWKWGTLAQASLAGGAPREVLKEVQLADWASDGATLAIVRLVGGRSRVEFGIGKVLYETPDRIGALRISPKGDRIGFAESRPGLGGSWSVGILDLRGKKEILSSGWSGEFIDLAWSAAGNEIWFNTRQGGDGSLHAVTLSGRHRLLSRTASPLQLFDVSRDGRALVGSIHWRSGILGFPPGETKERDLSWLDASELDDISQDGNSLLITEFGEGGGGDRWSVYLRKTDNSPAVRLGDGQAFALSPDGSRALSLRRTSPPQLILWPTGAGEPIFIKNDKIADYYWGDWLPDGKRIIFSGVESGRGPRCYIQNIAEGEPQPVTPEGTTLRVGQRAISPDGEWAVAMDLNGKASLYPVAGGQSQPIPGVEPGDVPIRWTVDERSLLVFRKSELVPKVYAVDLKTGRNELWKEIIPANPAGIMNVWGVHVGPDDKSYYYSYMRSLSALYVVEGLK